MKYRPKVPSYPHQKQANAKMRGKEAFALLMQMRTGKTHVALTDFGELELAGKVRSLLVIAPAGVYRTWTIAMKEHLSNDLYARLRIHVWRSGAGKGEHQERAAFMIGDERPRCLLMNVEALSKAGEARELCQEFLRQQGKNMVIADESTTLKNPSSKRTKFLIKIIRPLAKYRRILSGLPTPRSPLDLFSQFEFLDWNILGFRSYYAFRAHVAIIKPHFFGGRTVQLVVGYRQGAEDELQKLIAPHSFRVPFRPDIPSTYTLREVTMTSEQRRAYEEIRDFATTQLGEESHVTATVVIAQIMRMHQVLCGHVKDENGTEHIIPEHRTTDLIEFLDDYAGKAIIWCSYDHDIRKVSAALEKAFGEGCAARFWGGNLKTREAEEKRFLNDPTCRFEVATPSAGGRGRTWSVADLVIYYSSTDNLEHRDQSEQRAMGMDKRRQVDFVDFVVPDTVEMKILHALRKKINMSSAINGDTWREWLV